MPSVVVTTVDRLPDPRVGRRHRVSDVVSHLTVALGLVVFAMSCGSTSHLSEATTTSTVSRSAKTSVQPIEACALVSRAEASRIAGEQLERKPAPVNELARTSCYFASTTPPDPAEGRVVKVMQITVYDGEEFFDREHDTPGRGTRTRLSIGDEAFVRVGEGLLGVIVEVRVGSAVYYAHYVELAVLSDEPADAAAKRAALVDLIAEKFDH